MDLADLAPGQRAIIQHVGGEGAFRRRLLELGLLPGTEVEHAGTAPLGDPVAYRIRGAVLSLRRRDARLILVERS
ncbi:MAG: Fe2+ transport system protein FeoA [Kiritimatiellia bacterium]|jgi:Fe2+ transport system protein FeoA